MLLHSATTGQKLHKFPLSDFLRLNKAAPEPQFFFSSLLMLSFTSDTFWFWHVNSVQFPLTQWLNNVCSLFASPVSWKVRIQDINSFWNVAGLFHQSGIKLLSGCGNNRVSHSRFVPVLLLISHRDLFRHGQLLPGTRPVQTHHPVLSLGVRHLQQQHFHHVSLWMWQQVGIHTLPQPRPLPSVVLFV